VKTKKEKMVTATTRLKVQALVSRQVGGSEKGKPLGEGAECDFSDTGGKGVERNQPQKGGAKQRVRPAIGRDCLKGRKQELLTSQVLLTAPSKESPQVLWAIALMGGRSGRSSRGDGAKW